MENYLNHIFDSLDSSIKLDQNQKEVVLDESENLLVIAGAGSGKTITIIAKIKYLVEVKKIKPEEILVLSFTNKTVNELKEKINIKFGINAKISTFHKLAYDILKSVNARYEILQDGAEYIKKCIKNNHDSNKINKFLRKEKTYKIRDNKYIDNNKYLSAFVIRVLNLTKISGLSFDDIFSKNKRTEKFIEYLKDIKEKYERTLEINKLLDFDDLIIRGTEYISDSNLNFQYIFIDEFQDISPNRFEFIRKIKEKCNSKMIAVGDDFQTIYSFSGSNIDLFLSYKEKLNARTIKIVNTYRCSQELIDIAGYFIMKNDMQIKKELISNKTIDNPIKIYGYKVDKDLYLEKIIDEIIKSNPNGTILLLGRYNSDIDSVLNRNIINLKGKIKYKKNPNINIEFMTVHSSKGLESDNVVLLNGINSVMGFPCKIEEDSIIKELFSNVSSIYEERRLFYVALTRTKNRIYILTKIKEESEFICEISKNKNVINSYEIKYNKKGFNT